MQKSTRITWVILAAFVALLVVAGVDALRFSETETAAPPPEAATTEASPTVVEAAGTALPSCTRRQLALSVEVPRGIVVRNMQAGSCHQEYLDFHFTIRDRAGDRVRFWPTPTFGFGGDYAAGSRHTVPLPLVPSCPRRSLFVALATAGPYSARAHLSGSEIGCASTFARLHRPRQVDRGAS